MTTSSPTTHLRATLRGSTGLFDGALSLERRKESRQDFLTEWQQQQGAERAESPTRPGSSSSRDRSPIVQRGLPPGRPVPHVPLRAALRQSNMAPVPEEDPAPPAHADGPAEQGRPSRNAAREIPIESSQRDSSEILHQAEQCCALCLGGEEKPAPDLTDEVEVFVQQPGMEGGRPSLAAGEPGLAEGLAQAILPIDSQSDERTARDDDRHVEPGLPVSEGKDVAAGQAESAAAKPAPSPVQAIAVPSQPEKAEEDAEPHLPANPAGGPPVRQKADSSTAPAPESTRVGREPARTGEIAFQLKIEPQDHVAESKAGQEDAIHTGTTGSKPDAENSPSTAALQASHRREENGKRPASAAFLANQVRSPGYSRDGSLRMPEWLPRAHRADKEDTRPTPSEHQSFETAMPERVVLQDHHNNIPAAGSGGFPGQSIASSWQDAPVKAAQHSTRHAELAAAGDATPHVPPRPLRTVSLDLGQDHNARVSLNLVEKAGRVEITVRSADSALNRALRGELGELVGRMHEAGFEAQALKPAAAAGAIALDYGAADSPGGPSGSQRQEGDTESGRRSGGGSPQERGNGNREGRPGDEPPDGAGDALRAAWQRAWMSEQHFSEVSQ